MPSARYPLLLLVSLLSCGCLQAASRGGDDQNSVSQQLREGTFRLLSVTENIELKIQELGRHNVAVTNLEERVASLEAKFAEDVAALRETASAGCGDTQALLGAQLKAISQSTAKAAAELQELREELTSLNDSMAARQAMVHEQLAALGLSWSDQLKQLTTEQLAAQLQTTASCQDSSQQLATEMRQQAAAAQLEQQQQRERSALQQEQLTEQLGRLERQLASVGEQLQQDRAEREQYRAQLLTQLVTTTPAPTADPKQVFLNNLLKSLQQRRDDQH